MTVSKTSISSPIAIIGKQGLIREILAKSIGIELKCDVRVFEDTESLQNALTDQFSAIIIIDIGSIPGNNTVFYVVGTILCKRTDANIVLIRDSEGINQVQYSIRRGVRGYITTSTPIDIAIKAIEIVIAGGIYIPADEFVSGLRINKSDFGSGREITFPSHEKEITLTSREKEVVGALRKGKANKVIAQELNMSENTVKVHVHKVMKKLNARNRTEVALHLVKRNDYAY